MIQWLCALFLLEASAAKVRGNASAANVRGNPYLEIQSVDKHHHGYAADANIHPQGWDSYKLAGYSQCAEALRQQSLPSALQAYNLDNLPINIGGYPKGTYTSTDQGGGLSVRVPDFEKSCPRKIQKKLHFIWFGSWMPDKYSSKILTAARKNQAWTVVLWTTMKEPAYRQLKARARNIQIRYTPQFYGKFLNGRQIQAAENPSAKTDWMRLEVVYKEGGIYLDTDTNSVAPFDKYGTRFQWPFVVFDNGAYRNLCSCAFGAEAGSKFVHYALKSMQERKAAGWPVDKEYGCGLFTGAFVHYDQSAIQMFSSDNMLHPVSRNKAAQVMFQDFGGSWLGGKWKQYQ